MRTPTRTARTFALAAMIAAVGSLVSVTDAAPRLVGVGSNRVIFEINQHTGTGTTITTASAGGASNGELAYDCSTGQLYMASTSLDNLYTVDLSTGTATLVGSLGPSSILMHGMALDTSTGTLYGGSEGGLYSINRTTGFSTLIGSSGLTGFLNLGYNSRTDTMYAIESGTDALYTVNRATGGLTLIGTLDGPSNAHALAYNKDNGVLYLADPGGDWLYHVNTDTGQAHKVGRLPIDNILGMTYVPDTCAEPTVPNGAGYCVPYSTPDGSSTVVHVSVLPVAGGTPSTGIVATADFQPFGGAAAQVLTPAPNNKFTYTLNIPAGQSPGDYMIPITFTDAQSRVGNGMVKVTVRSQPPAGITEVEPNDTQAQAQLVELSNGQSIVGFSTDDILTGGLDPSADTFRIKTAAAAPGIYRHRMTITTLGILGHTGTLRGHSQSGGVINTSSDFAAQTSSTTSSPPRFNQWYGFGKREEVIYRVVGGPSTENDYITTLETTEVTPIVASTNFNAGPITITRAPGASGTIDFLIYDSNFNAYEDFMGEGNTTTPAPIITRTIPDGVYYMAVSTANTADHRASPGDSPNRANSVLALPGYVSNSSTTLAATLSMSISDGTHTEIIPTPKDEPFKVTWVKFTVGNPVVNQRCQPADIACDDGTPLPADTGLHPNGGVNEGDYNSFFQGFFDAAANCDIANDDATPRAPFGANGVNGGVNEGDYNCFFQKFFDGCPA